MTARRLHRFDLTMRIVTPNAGEGGTITPSDPQTVQSGQTVTFEVDSEAGYQVATVAGCGVYSNNGRFWTTAPILDDCTVVGHVRQRQRPNLQGRL